MELPLEYTEKMKALLGTEYAAYLDSFTQKRLYGLRVNRLKISPADLQEKGIFSLSPIPWCNTGFYYAEGERPAKHPYYHAGLYYLQEPSAMTPAALLPIEEGDRVLDICAAPGGKTTQLAAKLQGTGILVANDISAGRAKSLLKNVELSGITNCFVISEPPKKLAERFSAYFDKILIDAPCSGEGMFRKEPDMVKSWNEELLTFCREQQADILEHCAGMLKKGGMLLYSTCTFDQKENEGSIQDFLDSHLEFHFCLWKRQKALQMVLHPLQTVQGSIPIAYREKGILWHYCKKQKAKKTALCLWKQGFLQNKWRVFWNFKRKI